MKTPVGMKVRRQGARIRGGGWPVFNLCPTETYFDIASEEHCFHV